MKEGSRSWVIVEMLRIYREARCGKLPSADAANQTYVLARLGEAVDYDARCEILASMGDEYPGDNPLPPHFNQ